jgi:hypothetical protein
MRLHQALILIADTNSVHVFSPRMQCVHTIQYNHASRVPGLPSLAIPGSAVCTFFAADGAEGAFEQQQQRQVLLLQGGNSSHAFSSSAGNSAASLRSDSSFRGGGGGGVSSPALTVFPIALPDAATVGSILLLHLDAAPTHSAAGGGGNSSNRTASSPAMPNTRLKIVHRRSVAVHNKAVGVVAFCPNGRFVASCSAGGTAIKLTHAQSGSVLMQFNRGTTPNQIHSIAFSSNMGYLACVSSTGSVHLFAIVSKVQEVLAQLNNNDSSSSSSGGGGVGSALSGDQESDDLSNRHLGGAAPAAAAAAAATGEQAAGDDEAASAASAVSPLSQVPKNAPRSTGVFGFLSTMMRTTASFHDGVWSCGHFDLLQLHPSAAKRALFGPAIAGFLEGIEDDGSLCFFVAHGESGKIGKVSFAPNKKQAAVVADGAVLGGAATGGGVTQSQSAAAVQAPMGTCELVHAHNFPTDYF